MTYPKCYNCGEELVNVNQFVDKDITYINFIHKSGSACVDILEPEYIVDPNNASYFVYLHQLIKQLEEMKKEISYESN